MPSSTSSSEARFVIALATTLCVLVGAWELVLRLRGGATVDVDIKSPALTSASSPGEQWVIFGNCLMMTGIVPRRLNEELGPDRERVVLNIAWHEQSPIAFFDYLRHADYYPDVIITNVSSWLNGTNFEQEGELVAKADPLGLAALRPGARGSAAGNVGQQAYKEGGDLGSGRFQRSTEATLSEWGSKHVRSFGHRYHLFDYGLFLGTLATTGDLDNALYQLGMQSWFKVTGSETDGFGYLGLEIDYRKDWPAGVDHMADRSLQRLRLSRLLTPRYWSLLEENVRHFQAHGTQVILVRMPEHPKIRTFNEETYEISATLAALEKRTGAPVLDLSKLGPSDGVDLFDAVHPDAPSAVVITRELGLWLRARHVTVRGSKRLGGG
jgi:hypothetical protein